MTEARTGPRRVSMPVATLLVLSLAAASPVAASTDPEDSPPPSCGLRTAAVVAGNPLALSGTNSTDEPVGVMARGENGRFVEGIVAQAAGAWSSSLSFGMADAGSWTVEEIVDGMSCVSLIQVTLPPGAAAPPPVQVRDSDPSVASGLGLLEVRDGLIPPAILLVLLSWLFLLGLGVARLIGRTPLRSRSTQRLAQAAAVTAVAGVAMFAWALGALLDGLRHFDGDVPPDEQVLITAGFWVALVTGTAVGLVAARRLGRGSVGVEAFA